MKTLFIVTLLAAPCFAANHKVAIRNMTFDPPKLEVSVGDTVTWTNEDFVPHTATVARPSKDFDSGSLTKGKSFTYTTSKKGDFPYVCNFHPTMKASLTVR
jgi:plastocyanin